MKHALIVLALSLAPSLSFAGEIAGTVYKCGYYGGSLAVLAKIVYLEGGAAVSTDWGLVDYSNSTADCQALADAFNGKK